jgi:phosphate starvation-inducible protein PhoH and related proteins
LIHASHENNAIFTPKTRECLVAIADPDSGLAANLSSLLGVHIQVQASSVVIAGHDARIVKDMLERIEPRLEKGDALSAQDLMNLMDKYKPAAPVEAAPTAETDLRITTRKKTATPSSPGQATYVDHLLNKDLAFGLGPAGTGKTFLAVGAAIQFLQQGRVDKIILTRPAVEAGEKLGYLPGDMKEKVDPFMQPLYDSINEFMTSKEGGKLIEEKVIEISPLAYMRGRTLKNAFVILDEAQNATTMQMKMFLTRLGEGSRMAIVGDPKQVDLPRGVESGLADAAMKLRGIEGIGISQMTAKDQVRHPLVTKILEAYETD